MQLICDALLKYYLIEHDNKNTVRHKNTNISIWTAQCSKSKHFLRQYNICIKKQEDEQTSMIHH